MIADLDLSTQNKGRGVYKISRRYMDYEKYRKRYYTELGLTDRFDIAELWWYTFQEKCEWSYYWQVPRMAALRILHPGGVQNDMPMKHTIT